MINFQEGEGRKVTTGRSVLCILLWVALLLIQTCTGMLTLRNTFCMGLASPHQNLSSYCLAVSGTVATKVPNTCPKVGI